LHRFAGEFRSTVQKTVERSSSRWRGLQAQFFLLFQKGGPLSSVPAIPAGGADIVAIAGILFFRSIYRSAGSDGVGVGVGVSVIGEVMGTIRRG
jgi:hypothetical protein